MQGAGLIETDRRKLEGCPRQAGIRLFTGTRAEWEALRRRSCATSDGLSAAAGPRSLTRWTAPGPVHSLTARLQPPALPSGL
jgi:hypothetical protein